MAHNGSCCQEVARLINKKMLTNTSQVSPAGTPARKDGASTIKVLALVEATSVNAVAKNMLEFQQSARERQQIHPGLTGIETSFVTFQRRRIPADLQNGFVIAARELGSGVDVIPEAARFDLRVLPAL